MSNYRTPETSRPKARNRINRNLAVELFPTQDFPFIASGGVLTMTGAAVSTLTSNVIVGNGALAITGSAISIRSIFYISGSIAPLTIAWDAATNAVGYILYWDLRGVSPYGNSVNVGNVLQYTFPADAFLANSTYNFAVSSLYIVGATAVAPLNVRLG